MRRILPALLLLLVIPSVARASILVFTDEAAWAALVGDITNVGFLGASSDFGADTSGNPIGPRVAADVLGSPSDKVGLSGTGQFEFEVASPESDDEEPEAAAAFALRGAVRPANLNPEVRVRINTPSIFGFALFDLTSDIANTPPVPLHELAIAIAGETFLVSDIVGLTTPPDRSAPDATVPFLGFVSTVAFDSFEFIHGDRVRQVDGTVENYWIDGLSYAESTTVPAPAPATLVLFALGLIGLGLRQRLKS